jgi:bifunctional non-homologous end joining protein LigD
LTKKDLAEYYLRVAPRMLPELANRPLVLVRCPEGIAEGLRKNCFFQKHLRDEIPQSVRTAPIEEKGQIGLYPVVDDLNGLLSLVQLGVLEIHMLGSRADNVERADRMIFDLDPAPDVSKARLIEATFYMREWLIRNKMTPFLKLTGGKGIHIVIPINPVLTWEEMKKVSKAIADEMAHRKRDWFVATVTKTKRTGKILVDYFRNSLGASSIVPYSTRATPGAPIALPISEKELTEELLSDPVTVRNAVDRLKKMKADPWEGI